MYHFTLKNGTEGEFALKRPTTGNRWRLQDFLASREDKPKTEDKEEVRAWERENYANIVAFYVDGPTGEIDFNEFDEGEFRRVQQDFFGQYNVTLESPEA